MKYHVSRLTRSLYSQNIQRGPPLGGVSWEWNKFTFYMSISIIAYLIFDISYLEQICKWGIKYAHLVMTDHMGSTCVNHYPHTKFHQCRPYKTLDIWFFVNSQSEQIRKWGIKYAHLVTTDHMGSTCCHHYPHTKFHQCSPYRTLDICFFFCY